MNQTKINYEYLKKFMCKSKIIEFCEVSTREFNYFLETGKDKTGKIDSKLKEMRGILIKQANLGGF